MSKTKFKVGDRVKTGTMSGRTSESNTYLVIEVGVEFDKVEMARIAAGGWSGLLRVADLELATPLK